MENIAFDTAGAGIQSSPKAQACQIDRLPIPNRLVSKASLIAVSGGRSDVELFIQDRDSGAGMTQCDSVCRSVSRSHLLRR